MKAVYIFHHCCRLTKCTSCTNGSVLTKILSLFRRYRHVFVSEFNLGFGCPKSDTCRTCESKEDNDDHVARYKAAFKEQDNDRNLAREGAILLVNFDMQKTLPLPKLSTSVAFYLRQVWLYNLGIHSVAKDDSFGRGFFHLWTEDKGGRGPEEVGSSILSFLQNIKVENDHLVAWSDSAGGQNKDFYIYLSMALSYIQKNV